MCLVGLTLLAHPHVASPESAGAELAGADIQGASDDDSTEEPLAIEALCKAACSRLTQRPEHRHYLARYPHHLAGIPRHSAVGRIDAIALIRYGEGGIRTLGRCDPSTDFESAAFNRSATSPEGAWLF
jgi:hypothetical protein